MKAIFIIVLSICFIDSAYAKIIFQDDISHDFESPSIRLDYKGQGIQNTSIQFGNNPLFAENGIINWNISNKTFEFNNSVDLKQNQLINMVVDNRPDAPLNPKMGQMYHNILDGNTYVYNGVGWEDITAIGSTSTKVVTVGTGLDYATIQDAMTYLSSLSGGIILLSAETHIINSAIDLSNVTLIGKGQERTILQISGVGKISSFDTRFNNLKIDVKSIVANMAIDIKNGSNSLTFDRVEFLVQDTGDSLIDSSFSTAPIVTIEMIKCTQSAGNGVILKNISNGNLSNASTIFVDGRSGDGVLKMGDWNVMIAEAGNVNTTGQINTIPERSIVLSKDMNLQAAINSLVSLGNGGSIILLPGIYDINETVSVLGDNISISGYGDASILRASGFALTGPEISVIQVGAANGSSPANGVVLKDFKVEVQSNIHGIRVVGGSDNRVHNVTVQKTAGQSGTGGSADIGIQMLDSQSGKLIRPVITSSRVFGNGGTIYFTDGIHVTSDPSILGVWGYNQGISNALVEGNFIDFIRETAYVFVGANDSSLFNNRASRMGAGGGGAYGIFMGKLKNVNMNANVFGGSLASNGIAIGVDSFGTGTTTEDSIFNNNIIDGRSDGGVGFAKGFELGSSNSRVLKSTFQSNVIHGASNIVTTAIQLRGDSDLNAFADNNIDGGLNSWNVGIDIQSVSQDRNILSGNSFLSVIQRVLDNGTDTKMSVEKKISTVNPGASHDIGSGYQVGTIWINTSTSQAFISVNDALGNAVWQALQNSQPPKTEVGQFLNNDGNGGSYNLNNVAWTNIPWNSKSFTEDQIFSHSLTVNPSRITVLQSGRYKINYSVHHNNPTGQRKNLNCAIRLNGTTFPSVSAESFSMSFNNTDRFGSNTGSAFFDLSAGDYFEIVCRRAPGASTGNAFLTIGSQAVSFVGIEKIQSN